MKKVKTSELDVANAIIELDRKRKDTMHLLAVYKEALWLACYELSMLLDNNNDKVNESYWLSCAIKEIEASKTLKAQTKGDIR